jgi:hypothetical protein
MHYTSTEICKALNIKRELLKDWLIKGFVTAEIQPKSQGIKAGFSTLDVCMIALFKKLNDRGFRRELAKKYIDAYRQCDIHDQAINHVVFMTDVDTGNVLALRKPIIPTSAYYQDIINLGNIMADMLSNLSKIRRNK